MDDFNIGDKVFLKTREECLEEINDFKEWDIIRGMIRHLGTEVTIASERQGGGDEDNYPYYLIEEDGESFNWHVEVFKYRKPKVEISAKDLMKTYFEE